MADRDDCLYGIVLDASALLLALNPDNALVAGCEIRKQPDCCPACAMNSDCNRVPVHDDCKCEAEAVMLGG